MKAVFLDRDGVINRAIMREGKPDSPANLQELEIPNEVLPALNALKKAGFLLIIVTNQPNVARGSTTKAMVETIHQELLSTLPITAIFTCYHDDVDRCECRKPRPGLLMQAAKQYGIDLKKSFMVGDRWRDVEAGQQAGCRTVWLDYGYAEKKPSQLPTLTAKNLTEAAEWILQEKTL